MAHLLYSAKGRDGRPVQGFIEAATAADARQLLLERGLGEVVLHQDPTVATDPKSLQGLDADTLRELARVSISAMRRPGLGPLLVDVARGSRWWLLFDLGLAGWGYVRNSAWLMAGGAALALLPFGFAIWQYRHGGRYNALLKAFAVGDWAQVRTLAARLRGISAKVPNMAFDLDIRLASIDARDGRLAEALASLEPWRARLAQEQPGMFENRVASVHASAGDRAGFVRLMAEAHAHTPGEPARIVDLALAHARFGEAGRAGELLAQVDADLLPPHARGFIAWIDGLVRLRQHRPEALPRLGEAVAEFLKLSANPAVWTALAICTCDHAVALAAAGRRDEARRELAEVWPIVRAHADRPLLHLLQAEGLAPSSK